MPFPDKRISLGGWYCLALLTAIYIMGSIDRMVVSVIAEPLKSHFHLSDKQIGFLGGLAYSATYAIAALPAGWLIDRGNRRNLLSVSVAVWGALTLVSGFVSSYAALLAARLLIGAAEAPITPGSLSVIADLFPRERRNTAVSTYYAGTAAGQVILFLGGSWLLMHFEWRSVFIVAGVPSILLAVLLLLTTREPIRGTFDPPSRHENVTVEASRTRPMAVVRTIWCNKPLLLTLPAICTSVGVSFSVTIWLTSFFVRVLHLTVSEGLMWTGLGFGICLTVGSILAGPLADRFSRGDPGKLALIPAIASILGLMAGLIMVLGSSEVVTIAGLAGFGFMCGFFFGTGYAVALSLAPPDQRGSVMAMIRMIATVFGTGSVPYVTGFLSDAIGGEQGLRFALAITILLLAVSAACFGWIHRLLKSDRGEMAESTASA